MIWKAAFLRLGRFHSFRIQPPGYALQALAGGAIQFEDSPHDGSLARLDFKAHRLIRAFHAPITKASAASCESCQCPALYPAVSFLSEFAPVHGVNPWTPISSSAWALSESMPRDTATRRTPANVSFSYRFSASASLLSVFPKVSRWPVLDYATNAVPRVSA